MTYTCDNCGTTFDTLSALRRHERRRQAIAAVDEANQDLDWETIDKQFRKRKRSAEQRARRVASRSFTDALERVEDGHAEAIYPLLAQYERHLAHDWNHDWDDRYWGFHRAFYEPITSVLEETFRSEGRAFLLDVLEAYWPERTTGFDFADTEPIGFDYRYGDYTDFPHISHVLTNAMGRDAIRTRRLDGVHAIAPDALEYLFLFRRHPGDDGPWIESTTYGWGIGHPDVPFTDSVVDLVDRDYSIWAGSVVEHAFHADQHAAMTLLETVFDRATVRDPWELLYGVARIDTGKYPDGPTRWNWRDVYPEFDDDGFDWDRDVERRFRTLVANEGLEEYLPEEWTFADFEL